MTDTHSPARSSTPSAALGQPAVLPSVPTRLGGFFSVSPPRPGVPQRSVPLARGLTAGFWSPVTVKWLSQAHHGSSCFQTPHPRETVETCQALCPALPHRLSALLTHSRFFRWAESASLSLCLRRTYLLSKPHLSENRLLKQQSVLTGRKEWLALS